MGRFLTQIIVLEMFSVFNSANQAFKMGRYAPLIPVAP